MKEISVGNKVNSLKIEFKIYCNRAVFDAILVPLTLIHKC